MLTTLMPSSEGYLRHVHTSVWLVRQRSKLQGHTLVQQHGQRPASTGSVSQAHRERHSQQKVAALIEHCVWVGRGLGCGKLLLNRQPPAWQGRGKGSCEHTRECARMCATALACVRRWGHHVQALYLSSGACRASLARCACMDGACCGRVQRESIGPTAQSQCPPAQTPRALTAAARSLPAQPGGHAAVLCSAPATQAAPCMQLPWCRTRAWRAQHMRTYACRARHGSASHPPASPLFEARRMSVC